MARKPKSIDAQIQEIRDDRDTWRKRALAAEKKILAMRKLLDVDSEPSKAFTTP